MAEPHQLDSEAPLERQRLRWFMYCVLLALFAAVALAALLNTRPLQSANDRSRWTTVWSLVERGTYRIDEIIQRPGWDTIDKVRHEEHFYSSKPPLLSTLVAGVYWGVKSATGWDLLRNTAEVARVILLLVNLLPMLAALVVLACLVERYAQTGAARIYIVAAAAFGTLLTPFLMTLNNHTVAAVSVVFAIYPAMRILIDDVRSPAYFALAGFFAAFVCTNELPAALFGLALFGLLAYHAPKRTLAVFVPAALVPLIAYFVTNYLATGGWKPFYMYYGTEKYLYEIDGVPSYWMNPAGLDKSRESPLVYLLHCTIGHHGILSLSPIFVLTLVAWVKLVCQACHCGLRIADRGLWSKNPQSATVNPQSAIGVPAVVGHPQSSILWLGLGLTVAVLGFYLTRTENYNYGGNSAGLRWMFWLIPFWLVGMVPVLDQWSYCRWFRSAAVLLLGISVFSATYPLTNPWQHPWLFNLMERWGWIDYSDKPPQFDRPLTTWFPALPDPETFGDSPWIEFAGLDPDGNITRLRLRALPREESEGVALRRLEVRWNRGRPDERTATYTIDEEAFNAGAPPTEFLRWPKVAGTLRVPSASAEKREEAYTFFRGLPRPRLYNAGPIRYLKTPLRRNAFRCQKGEARVLHSPPDSDRMFWYRTDLWLTPEVPFGVVRIETTIYDAATSAIVSRRELTAVRAGRD